MPTEAKARIEVKTRTVLRDDQPIVVLEIIFLPRGSGNRNKCRRLAAAFRAHERMGKHVRRVVSGSTKVTVHLTPSWQMMTDLMELKMEQMATADVAGQMPLFET